ncbi:hypothetical protein Rsub_11494 [Raphidocelis subcapitata]|uniref:Uncharacterized protein n=1 Tax=Raphidocelis subcapitata TaxID=307507 RepID=A0A2V0PKH5_9CHLO|nr:hypothetical protein Rsub_11494 [Raphidocelis subcapitata]|eukprot:GBF98503.1 hypothetical protein Rsub_11494 [Raphidocelis subcapitata]
MLHTLGSGARWGLRRHAGGMARAPCRAPLVRSAQRGGARGGCGLSSGTAARAMQIADHVTYLEEVSVTACPKLLPALLQVLQAQGHAIVPPSERAGLHPLVIPLAAAPAPPPPAGASVVGDAVVLGLLRWADPGRHKGMALPVVAMSRGARGVRLLARSVDEYLHRVLAEEEDAAGAGGPTPLADAASAASPAAVAELYSRGAVERSGLGGAKFKLYLVKKAGMYPDVSEALSLGHLARGDVTSALVAAEWYMRNNHFPGWGRPYEFAAELYKKTREEECRDVARLALRSPWWSLSCYEESVSMAQLSGTPEEVRWVLSEEAAAQRTGAVTGLNYREPVSPVMAAVSEAEGALDMVAAGQGDYESAREPVAAAYERAGLSDAANFIRAAS